MPDSEPCTVPLIYWSCKKEPIHSLIPRSAWHRKAATLTGIGSGSKETKIQMRRRPSSTFGGESFERCNRPVRRVDASGYHRRTLALLVRVKGERDHPRPHLRVDLEALLQNEANGVDIAHADSP